MEDIEQKAAHTKRHLKAERAAHDTMPVWRKLLVHGLRDSVTML